MSSVPEKETTGIPASKCNYLIGVGQAILPLLDAMAVDDVPSIDQDNLNVLRKHLREALAEALGG